ncbi:MAG: hypothetical protein H7Y88_13425 [Phycisphaerales bacterium]|nr:hypothetical protein [Phycisphaerales bacterium]
MPGVQVVRKNIQTMLLGIRHRLITFFEGASYRHVAGATGYHHEQVRRYLTTGKPAIDFVATVSIEFNLSLDWIIHGRGDPPLPLRARRELAMQASEPQNPPEPQREVSKGRAST